MNPQVALLIANIVCADPALAFRDFYQAYYVPERSRQSWAGRSGEDITTSMARLADGLADYTEYRIARVEQCGRAQK